MNKFWIKFQSYLGNTIPQFIVDILCSAGYDSALSISELNDDDITVIENHVLQKSELLKNSDSYTENLAENSPFTFLPGHRKLLFTLKSKATNFIEENKKSIVDNKSISTEEIELFSDEELKVLGNDLLRKLSTYSQTIGLGSTFQDTNIVTSIDAYISNNTQKAKKSLKTASYKCSVKCVSCERVIPCTYNNRWETGNIELHLKRHVPLGKEVSQDTASTLASTSTATHTTETADKKSDEVEHQLKVILES